MRRKMLCRAVVFAAVVFFAVCCNPFFAVAEPVSVSSESAVLISYDTASVIYEKNGYQQMPMASTTKIMTALLALEEAQRSGDPIVDITEEMVAVEGSSMGLQSGNRLALSGLAAGMLMASGNDAANAAAIYISGSQEEFARLMNSRAAELAMNNTNFVTPSGLDDEEHYSTAYDMAVLAREALRNSLFSKMASSSSYQVEFVEPEQKVTYSNHNKLLRLYEGCIGVKTGFTKKSGRCLVSAAERDGVKLIAVTLNAPDDWNDHMAMLDYGFSALESVSFDDSDFSARIPLVGSEKTEIEVKGGLGGSISLVAEDAAAISRKIILPRFLYAPVDSGEKVGKIKYYLGGNEIYSIPITAGENGTYKEKEPSFLEKLIGRKE